MKHRFHLRFYEANPASLVVLPGENEVISIDFFPLDTIVYYGDLRMKTNDPDQPELRFDVAGNGVNHAFVFEEYSFEDDGSPPEIDILFAVDRTCSMDDDIENLQNNFQSFFEELQNTDIDYRIAATVEDDGCIHDDNGLFIDNSFSATQTQDTITTMINLGGSYGSNAEMAFMLFEECINASIDPNGCNAGFIREEADLLLIAMSDEVGQSINSWEHYVSLFENIKDPYDVIVGGIGGDYPTGCGVNDPYIGLYEATLATDGPFFSICSTDYSSQLADYITGGDWNVGIHNLFELQKHPFQRALKFLSMGVLLILNTVENSIRFRFL